MRNSTMVPLVPSGGTFLLVLRSACNSANPFFNMYLMPLPSISALILVLDELVDFDCSPFVAMQWSLCSGNTIDRFSANRLLRMSSCAPLVLDSECFLLLWESILRIKLHLHFTIKLRWPLVQFALRRSSTESNRLLRTLHSIPL